MNVIKNNFHELYVSWTKFRKTYTYIIRKKDLPLSK
jgi:hypothetical protein